MTLIKKILPGGIRTLLEQGYTQFFGKFIGKDEFGNEYYERWVIYYGEVDASKICGVVFVDTFLQIKENNHNLINIIGKNHINQI